MTRAAICVLLISGFATSPSFAQVPELQRQVKKLETQVATLQAELARLQAHVVLRSGGGLALLSQGVREDTAGNNYRLNVGSSSTVEIGSSSTERVGRDRNLVVGGEWNAKATRTVVIEGGQGILLKSGRASIELRSNGQVAINGSVVDINASDIELKASKDVRVKGRKVEGN